MKLEERKESKGPDECGQSQRELWEPRKICKPNYLSELFSKLFLIKHLHPLARDFSPC